jgi:N-sulfoglucosamine sulfohydrolase
MKRFDTTHRGKVLVNLDDSPTKDEMIAIGWGDLVPPIEALYDVRIDPGEGNNRIDDPALGQTLSDLKERLRGWMEQTDDPLLNGPVAPADGTTFNTVDQISPSEPMTLSTATRATTSQ